MKWMNCFRICLALFLLINSVSIKAEGAINDVSIVEENDQLVLLLKSDQAIDYHCMQLADPDRFVVDLESMQLKTKLATVDNAFLKNVRSSNHEHYLRLVFDLKQRLHYVATLLDHNRELKITLKSQNTTMVTARPKKSH
jgi:hypothetical protein